MGGKFRQSSSVHHLRLLCGILLSLLALLTILGQLLVQSALQHITSDAVTINIAGRQRMLSQKISTSALAIQHAGVQKDTLTRQHYAAELRTALIQWQQAHRGLQAGTLPTEQTNKKSAEVARLFTALDPHYLAIANASSTLITCLNAPRPPTRAMIAIAVQSILAEAPRYLTAMNIIVLHYQHEVKDRIAQLKRIGWLLLAITIAVLCAESFCVFRPAVRCIKQTLNR